MFFQFGFRLFSELRGMSSSYMMLVPFQAILCRSSRRLLQIQERFGQWRQDCPLHSIHCLQLALLCMTFSKCWRHGLSTFSNSKILDICSSSVILTQHLTAQFYRFHVFISKFYSFYSCHGVYLFPPFNHQSLHCITILPAVWPFLDFTCFSFQPRLF